MDGGCDVNESGNSRKEKAEVEGGSKDDIAAVSCLDPLKASDLELQTSDLDPNTDDLDPDNGYLDETPPSSAFCSRSCSCDSCVNISLDFNTVTEPDLAHIENIEQKMKTLLVALSTTSRHRCRRISESSNRYAATLPRYTKIQSSRRVPYGRGFGVSRRAPRRSLRSQRVDQTTLGSPGARPQSQVVSETSQGPRSSTEDNSQHIAKTPASHQGESVALFDHMMSCDPSGGFNDPATPLETRSVQSNRSLRAFHTTSRNSLAVPTAPEAQRTVYFNTPHIENSHASPTHTSSPSPHSSATPIHSPHTCTNRLRSPHSSSNPIYSPHASATRIHSQNASATRIHSTHASATRIHTPHASTSRIRSSYAQSPLGSQTNTHALDPHSAKAGNTSTPVDIGYVKVETSLRCPRPGITPCDRNALCHLPKTARLSSTVSLPKSRSSSKFGDLLLRKSDSDSRYENKHTREEKSQVDVLGKKGSYKSLVRAHKIGIPTRQQTLREIPGQDTTTYDSRVRSRQPTKGRIQPSLDVHPSIRRDEHVAAHPALKKACRHASSRTPVTEFGTSTKRDVRHHPDSGVGSSASSTFSPSPRGPTNVHHYITKKRFEKTSNTSAAQTHSNQRTSTTSGSHNVKGPEADTIKEASNAYMQNCSDTGNRSQLEKDFHSLLESLGFLCHPNEPGNPTECQGSSKQLKTPALQQNPSLYSIPKANFLQTTNPRQTSDPQAPRPPTPAVLLSDDPDDPRRRTDLKAALHYLDNPVTQHKSNYRSELFAKVDANKSRSQSAEANRAATMAEDNAKPNDQSTDSRKASSLTSVAKRKTRPPVLSSVKPINLDQIRSIKQTVDNAIADQKIFVVYGAFPSIREALKSRGWIEKRPYPERKLPSAESDPTTVRNRGVGVQSTDSAVLALIESMTSNPNEVDFEEELTERAIVGRMLRNVDPNFIWTVKCEAMDWKRLKKRQLINRFPRAFFATKIGLSTFLRQMHWFSEEGISMTRFPRCYNICQADDMEAFVEDFRLTACLSVLKIVVDRFQKLGDGGVQDESGKVPKYAMEFAISRCAEYLVQNTHADLDRAAVPSVHCHQWDQFLAWSYELRTEKGRFSKTCFEPSPQVMSDTAKDLIKRMTDVWPQLDLDGVLNIWILKPGAKSRGRGIHLINRLDAVVEHVSPQHIRDARYVAQKYIERPLIIFGTKFDIRQWFLVTSVYPMTIWMYRESYLRFCSQSFSLTNMHESVHLCNNAVQAKYKNGKRDPALPDENMWDCYTFQTYLRALGRPELWDTVIYPGMRQGIIGTLLASQEHMDRRGDCFELFGADFMLTEDFNPWLIEINSCPCMAPSTSVTARMCAQCLEDVIKVVIDRRNDKNADTGRFELVYKQHIPPPPPYLGMSLSVRGRRVNNGSSSIISTGAASPTHSPKQNNRRVRRPASDPTRRRQRHPRIVLPETVGTARYRFEDKSSNDGESATLPDADEVTSSGSETDSCSVTTDALTSADAEGRPPRTPTPTCPPSRMENLRCSHRPCAVAAIVAKQKARQRAQHNVLAAVGHGVIQPSEDNHKKSMELLREWRQRARTSGLLARSSTNKLGSLSSANSAEMIRRMSSSSNGSGLMAVGVTLNSLLR